MEAKNYAADLMHILDGLILIGGHDVTPLLYGEEPRERIGTLKPDRDIHDAAIFNEAIANNIPILGVCRGLQLINVVMGGSLFQDLSEYEEISVQHSQNARPDYLTHRLIVDSSSYIAKHLMDIELVNSIHHQMIHKLAPGLRATAWATDKVIEAIETTEEIPLILAVQWHPETLFQSDTRHLALFTDLIERARYYKHIN